MTRPTGSRRRSTTRRNTPVQSLDRLQAGLRILHGTGVGWRQIQADLYPEVPAGTLCAIAAGREPRKASIRAALGLPPLPRFLYLGRADVPANVVQIGVDPLRCPRCRALFVSNHPRRRDCFLCSPPQIRRRS